MRTCCILCLVFLMFFTVSGQKSSLSSEPSWIISMVQRDNEDAEKPWIVEFWRPDGATNITKLSSKELLVTCRIMKVRRSVQLVGRRFIPSRNLTPSETLARRIFYFHNPKYKAPSPEAFWEMAKENSPSQSHARSQISRRNKASSHQLDRSTNLHNSASNQKLLTAELSYISRSIRTPELYYPRFFCVLIIPLNHTYNPRGLAG
jgi:hypothetical protein